MSPWQGAFLPEPGSRSLHGACLMSVVRLIERGESNDPPEGHAARGLWDGVRITGPKWFPLVRRVGWRPPLQSVEVHRARHPTAAPAAPAAASASVPATLAEIPPGPERGRHEQPERVEPAPAPGVLRQVEVHAVVPRDHGE